jgi:hypothetical protein
MVRLPHGAQRGAPLVSVDSQRACIHQLEYNILGVFLMWHGSGRFVTARIRTTLPLEISRKLAKHMQVDRIIDALYEKSSCDVVLYPCCMPHLHE